MSAAALESLVTARLDMRPLSLADAADVVALHSDARVTAPLIDGVPRTAEQALLYWQWSEACRVHGFPGVMHTRHCATGDFLGVFTLVPMDDGVSIDLGARLLPHAWGQGYAVEGGAALLAHAFGALGLSEVSSMTSVHNRTVPFVLAQLGFRFVGTEEMFGQPARRFALAQTAWSARGGVPCDRRDALAALRAAGLLAGHGGGGAAGETSREGA